VSYLRLLTDNCDSLHKPTKLPLALPLTEHLQQTILGGPCILVLLQLVMFVCCAQCFSFIETG